MSDGNIGKREFDVKLYDVGPDGKARVRALFNYMQSAADSHSMSLGTSMNIMSERNLTWVYARFYTEIERFPMMYDTVFCETWRSVVADGLVNREFLLSGTNGEVLLRAAASLALIDKTSRKPVEIPEFITSQLEPQRGRAVNYIPFNVEKTDNFDYVYRNDVRFEDMDINGHMNNASYAQMFFESSFSCMQKPLTLKKIDILFKGEIVYGDVINCGVKKLEGTGARYYHSAYNEKRGRVSAVAVTGWE